MPSVILGLKTKVATTPATPPHSLPSLYRCARLSCSASRLGYRKSPSPACGRLRWKDEEDTHLEKRLAGSPRASENDGSGYSP